MAVLDHSLGTIETELETRALEVVAHQTREALASEAFVAAAQPSVATVLRLDALAVREVDLFQAVYLSIR
jgi:hypothetical protein